MTLTQQQTYNAIKQHHYTYGVTPTYKELMITLGIALNATRKRVIGVERAGLIKVTPRRKRGIYLK